MLLIQFQNFGYLHLITLFRGEELQPTIIKRKKYRRKGLFPNLSVPRLNPPQNRHGLNIRTIKANIEYKGLAHEREQKHKKEIEKTKRKKLLLQTQRFQRMQRKSMGDLHKEQLPIDQLTPRKFAIKKSAEAKALYNIVEKLNTLENQVEYFNMKATLNQKLRAESTLLTNWPEDNLAIPKLDKTKEKSVPYTRRCAPK